MGLRNSRSAHRQARSCPQPWALTITSSMMCLLLPKQPCKRLVDEDLPAEDYVVRVRRECGWELFCNLVFLLPIIFLLDFEATAIPICHRTSLRAAGL